MKTLTKSALSVAILTAISTTSAQAEQFMNDSSLNIHLRNYYMDKDVQKNTAKADKDKSWTQAFRADLSSGYFADIIGVDLSAHYALRLSESRGTSTDNGLLQKGNRNKGHSYGKNFGAVKVNLMGNGVAKYGRMELDTPLLNDSDSRSLSSTTEAFYADYTIKGFTVYGAVAKKGSDRAQSGYEDYEVFVWDDRGGTNPHNGEIDINDEGNLIEPIIKNKKEAVKTIGVSYEMDSLNLGAAYAKQDDWISALYTEVGYGFDLDAMTSVKLGAQYGKVSAIGDSKTYFIDKPNGEKSSISWHGLMAGITYDKLSASLSMTDVSNAKGGLSDAGPDWVGGEDDTSFNGYNAVQISDFNASNETSYKVKIGYDFSDTLEGLSAYALYVSGDRSKTTASSVSMDTSEYNIRIDYTVPQLDGLKLTFRHAKYEEDATGKANDQTKKDTRVLITYDMAVF